MLFIIIIIFCLYSNKTAVKFDMEMKRKSEKGAQLEVTNQPRYMSEVTGPDPHIYNNKYMYTFFIFDMYTFVDCLSLQMCEQTYSFFDLCCF